MSNTAVILFMIGFAVVILLINYIVRAVVNKGADAISNAMAEKKNKKNTDESENLADRFK